MISSSLSSGYLVTATYQETTGLTNVPKKVLEKNNLIFHPATTLSDKSWETTWGRNGWIDGVMEALVEWCTGRWAVQIQRTILTSKIAQFKALFSNWELVTPSSTLTWTALTPATTLIADIVFIPSKQSPMSWLTAWVWGKVGTCYFHTAHQLATLFMALGNN